MTVTSTLSALAALNTRMTVSAHNVANMNTPGYKARVAHQTAGPAVTVKLSQRSPDMIDEIVEQKQVLYNYKANLIALKTYDEILHTALEIGDDKTS